MSSYTPMLKQTINESKFEDDKHKFYYHRKITNKWLEKGYVKLSCLDEEDKYGVLSMVVNKFVMFMDHQFNIYRGVVKMTTPTETDNVSEFNPKFYFDNSYSNEKLDIDDEVFNFDELKLLDRNKYEIRGFYHKPTEDKKKKKPKK